MRGASAFHPSADQSASPQWNYDVFLSFRGVDTRNGILSHLYHELQNRCIKTFMDDPKLERGTTISSELFKAIQESRLAIVVLSPNYASSSWCLDELTKILQCMKSNGTVLPVFYNVDPSDVQNKAAVLLTPSLSMRRGLGKTSIRCERKLIEKIVEWVWRKVHRTFKLLDSTELVGIKFTREQMDLLVAPTDDVRFVGIWGMGGIGKTTIARLIQQQITNGVEHQRASAFLPSADQSAPPQWNYDVFLSFKGVDTRNGFVSHLYHELQHRCIKTFKDDPKLERGTTISSELFKAIQESRLAIVVVSPNYPSSCWCLDELTKILQCMKSNCTVLPVFFNVDPSDVRKQSGSFAGAITEHEKRFREDIGKVKRWRAALTEVANLSGFDSKNQCERKLIEKIVEWFAAFLLMLERLLKVLLILDDVNASSQLEKFAKEKDWFGKGSIIIITTRDERLVKKHDMEISYKVQGLDDDKALKLFSRNAFKKFEPEEGFRELCNCFVNYAGGLPLALKILGCSVYKRDRDEWKNELDKLRKIPKIEIFNLLKISFDRLDEMNKNIFLDVAFFHKGKDKKKVIQILDSCGRCGGINALVEKSLLSFDILSNIVGMHDLIQEMAFQIVRQESPEEPGGRSRLCHRNDIIHVVDAQNGWPRLSPTY
ncbi:Putative disease resistance TIR-NBS-LRR class protein [Prunus dulcis]|uniref:Disease resistance TIR-NBS-LRR class protein n=1 Tax=Prunus dulcis TaxID=3755 RepID=A0A5H2XSZ8_PRUDU|nr:Putative disease resistance TIR-NBS-LRR class protein [Prunus dulcis]